MNFARLSLAVPLALVTAACTTEQAVDDTIRVVIDLTVEDVDLECSPNETNEVDDASMERIGGWVSPDSDGCVTVAYYRGPILDFQQLRDDLPDGVEEIDFTSVGIEIEEMTPRIENFDRLPTGTAYQLALAVATEDDLSTFEGSYDDSLVGADFLNYVDPLRTDTNYPRGTLAAVAPDMALSEPLLLDELVNIVLAQSAYYGDPESLAEILDEGFESGADDLYILGGAYFRILRTDLPTEPSDLTLTLTADINYEASAKVNLLDAAQGAQN